MENENRDETVEKILEKIRKLYGFVPVTSQVLSEDPDVFIPYSSLSRAIFDRESAFDCKTKHLLAIAAAAALGSEHCMRNQVKDAVANGATEEEILEVMVIAGYMGMTRVQSYAFRVYAEQFGKKLE